MTNQAICSLITLGVVLAGLVVCERCSGQQRGVFSPAAQEVPVPWGLNYVAYGDVNLDGTVDLVAATGSQVVVRLGLGGGDFASTGALIPFPGTPHFALLEDLDGDGDLDLIVNHQAANTAQLETRLNDGSGGFAAAGPAVASVLSVRAAAVGDVDLDGDLDIVLPDQGFARVYLGDGTGAFGATAQSVAMALGDQGTVLLEDLDGDGDLDLVSSLPIFTDDPGVCSVRLNSGNGVFPATGQEVMIGGGANQIRLADVNQDNVVDLVSANSQVGGCSVRLGLGNGSFASTGFELATAQFPYSLALGDIDRDGDPDLITANVIGPQAWVFFGDGTGGFTRGQVFHLNPALTFTTSLDFAFSLTLFDVDSDGDLDLTPGFQSGFGNPVPIFRNEYAGFLRGDSNLDGSVNLSDPIELLYALFAQGGELLCQDAADVNDDGALNLADPIGLVYSLFGVGAPIPAPITTCGFDVTQDALTCDVRNGCP